MSSTPSVKSSSKAALILWAILTFGCAIAIAVLTLMSVDHVPTGVAFSDKVYHLIAFAALVVPTAVLRLEWSARVGVAAVLFGATIEIIQPYFEREAEWLDVVANGFGVLLGLASGMLLLRVVRKLCSSHT